MNVRVIVQEGQGIDELPRVLGRGGLVEPPAGGLLQGLVEFRGCVLHDEEEPVRVVEKAVAGHDVRVLDPAVDLHLCVCLCVFWEEAQSNVVWLWVLFDASVHVV